MWHVVPWSEDKEKRDFCGFRLQRKTGMSVHMRCSLDIEIGCRWEAQRHWHLGVRRNVPDVNPLCQVFPQTCWLVSGEGLASDHLGVSYWLGIGSDGFHWWHWSKRACPLPICSRCGSPRWPRIEVLTVHADQQWLVGTFAGSGRASLWARTRSDPTDWLNKADFPSSSSLFQWRLPQELPSLLASQIKWCSQCWLNAYYVSGTDWSILHVYAFKAHSSLGVRPHVSISFCSVTNLPKM